MSPLTREHAPARPFPGARLLPWASAFGGEGCAPASLLRDRSRPGEWGCLPALRLWPSVALPTQLARLGFVESGLHQRPAVTCAGGAGGGMAGRLLPDATREAQRAAAAADIGPAAAPPAGLLACHAMLVAGLRRAACAVLGMRVLPGVGDALCAAACASAQAAGPRAATGGGAGAGACAGGLGDGAAGQAAAAVARLSHCASALQLQRAAQLLSLLARLAPSVAPLASTVASLRALCAALLAFVATHVGAVLDHCLWGAPLPAAPLPLQPAEAAGAAWAAEMDAAERAGAENDAEEALLFGSGDGGGGDDDGDNERPLGSDGGTARRARSVRASTGNGGGGGSGGGGGGGSGGGGGGGAATLEGTGTVARATAVATSLAAALQALNADGVGVAGAAGRGCCVGGSLSPAASALAPLVAASSRPVPLLTATAALCAASVQSALLRALLLVGAMGSVASAEDDAADAALASYSPALPDAGATARSLRVVLAAAASAFPPTGASTDVASAGGAGKRQRRDDYAPPPLPPAVPAPPLPAKDPSTASAASLAARGCGAAAAATSVAAAAKGGTKRTRPDVFVAVDDESDGDLDLEGRAAEAMAKAVAAAASAAAAAGKGAARGGKSRKAGAPAVPLPSRGDDDADSFGEDGAALGASGLGGGPDAAFARKRAREREARGGESAGAGAGRDGGEDSDDAGGKGGAAAGPGGADYSSGGDDLMADEADADAGMVGERHGGGGGLLGAASATAIGRTHASLLRDACATALVDAIAMAQPAALAAAAACAAAAPSGVAALEGFRRHLRFALPLAEASVPDADAAAAASAAVAAAAAAAAAGEVAAEAEFAVAAPAAQASLSDVLRRYALLSPAALLPSAFAAAVASVALAPDAGGARETACVRALAAVASRLAQSEASSGVMVRQPSPRGAAARGWDVVGGRLALQAALLAVSLCADTRALLDAPPVAAREAALPRALYAALPHVQLRCTALSEWGAAAGGPGGRRGELEESAEAEAGRLGCLFVPFGAELHASAASEPSVSAASALFALAHHLNPLAGHAEPGALLADVVACVGLLVRHASADALNTAAEAVSSFFSRLFAAAQALEAERRVRDQVQAALAVSLHRRVMPWSPLEPGSDWPLALLLRSGANAALSPGAQAAAGRALPAYASAFSVELLRRAATVGEIAAVAPALAHQLGVLPERRELLPPVFPGLPLPPLHATELLAACGARGPAGWSDSASARAASSVSAAAAAGISAAAPFACPPLGDVDNACFTDGAATSRGAQALWSLALLVARCAPEGNTCLLQLVLRE
jgi:hypothetical protein